MTLEFALSDENARPSGQVHKTQLDQVKVLGSRFPSNFYSILPAQNAISIFGDLDKKLPIRKMDRSRFLIQFLVMNF
jgi:hypothetical protein